MDLVNKVMDWENGEMSPAEVTDTEPRYRIHHFWNGSASFHPEQPTEWPGVTARVHLPAGRYDLQQQIAEGFHKVIEEVLK